MTRLKREKKEENPDDKLMARKQFYLKYRNHIVPWFYCGVQGLRWTQGTDFDLPMFTESPPKFPSCSKVYHSTTMHKEEAEEEVGHPIFLDYRNPKP